MYQLVLEGWKQSVEAEEVPHQAMDESGESLDDTVERKESGYRPKMGASMGDDGENDKGPCQPLPQAPSVSPTIGECLELFKRMNNAADM